MIPILSQANKDTKKGSIDYQIDKIYDFVELKKEAIYKKEKDLELAQNEKNILENFKGVEFPSNDEIPSVLELIEHMKNKIRIVDARDVVPKHLINHQTKVEKLNEMRQNPEKGLTTKRIIKQELHESLADMVRKDINERIIT